MGRNSEALEAARKAAAAAPEDIGARKELQKCEQKANRDRSVERKLAKRMLGTQPQGKGGEKAPEKKPSRSKVRFCLLCIELVALFMPGRGLNGTLSPRINLFVHCRT